MNSERLELALHTLGEVLQDRELTYDLIAIGGGALLLQDLVHRPTEDIDIIARAEGDSWVYAKPAIRWCARLDGRPDFYDLDVRPIMEELGVELEAEND